MQILLKILPRFLPQRPLPLPPVSPRLSFTLSSPSVILAAILSTPVFRQPPPRHPVAPSSSLASVRLLVLLRSAAAFFGAESLACWPPAPTRHSRWRMWERAENPPAPRRGNGAGLNPQIDARSNHTSPDGPQCVGPHGASLSLSLSLFLSLSLSLSVSLTFCLSLPANTRERTQFHATTRASERQFRETSLTLRATRWRERES